MTSHSRMQLSLQMADDLRRESFRLRNASRSRLTDLCELWVEAYENADIEHQLAAEYHDIGYSPATKEQAKQRADFAVREAMPLWLWFTIGQILLKLIWQWWQNRENSELA